MTSATSPPYFTYVLPKVIRFDILTYVIRNYIRLAIITAKV